MGMFFLITGHKDIVAFWNSQELGDVVISVISLGKWLPTCQMWAWKLVFHLSSCSAGANV